MARFAVYLFAVAVVTVLSLSAACGTGGIAKSSATATPTSYNLKGVLTAPECAGGYSITNAAVTVRNEKNEIVATATTVMPPAPPGTTLEDKRASINNQLDAVESERKQILSKYPFQGTDFLGKPVSFPTGGTPPAGSTDADRLVQLASQEQQLQTQYNALPDAPSGCTVTFSATVPRAQFYQIKSRHA